MNRTEVIQKISDKKKAQSYLEIGVAYGNNFFPVEVPQKVAVDPDFKLKFMRKLTWAIKNPYNRKANVTVVQSDAIR